MKKIIFIRHAKSSWDDPSTKDHDRILNHRGEDAAALMNKILKSQLKEADAIFSSTAKRAKQTIEIISDGKYTIEFKEDLYTFEYNELIRFIVKLDNKLNTVVIVGHNPALTNIIGALSANKIFNMPTCGVAALLWTEASKWTEVIDNSARLVFFDCPKNHL